MAQHTFKTSDSGKEFPARFGGQEITYDYPEDLAAVRESMVPEGADADAVIYGAVMGQGLHLTKQKAAKDYLDSDEAKELDVAEAISRAAAVATSTQLSVPGTRRGTGRATKAAKAEARATEAEAKVDQAKQALADAYTKLPKNLRSGFGADLVERGVFTQEELDALTA